MICGLILSVIERTGFSKKKFGGRHEKGVARRQENLGKEEFFGKSVRRSGISDPGDYGGRRRPKRSADNARAAR